ncbi:MAG: hypothetical protein HY040_19425 [Planctomycetes bacterium]|nr:hypothetical protein [Planctomycetota bacterium]
MKMPFSIEIATALTNQLARFTALNRHQLAGQVANLDLWMAEVAHCLVVIDGYNARSIRCFHEDMLEERKLRDLCATLDLSIDPKDLRQRR